MDRMLSCYQSKHHQSSHIYRDSLPAVTRKCLGLTFFKSSCSIPPSAVQIKQLQNPIGVSQTPCIRAAFHMCVCFFSSDPLVTDFLTPQGFAAVQRPGQRRCLSPRHRRGPRGGEGAGGDVHCQGTRPHTRTWTRGALTQWQEHKPMSRS